MNDAPSPAVLEARARVAELRERIANLGGNELDLILRAARTHNAWTDRPVPEELLRELMAIVRLGPTSQNCQPARFLFVRRAESKAKLAECASPTNGPKIKAAPVTVIVGYDIRFYEYLPRMFPHRPEVANNYRANAKLAETTAFRNGTLQGAYLIVAARALGLDTGPMSGFDNTKVDEAFFTGTSIRSNFLCSLGYGDEQKGVTQKLPRFDFDEVCHFA